MNEFQLALKNISGNVFRNAVVALCALLLSAFVLFTTLVMRGAESSLRLTNERLGADIVVVPAGSESKVESALLMGIPSQVWMSEENLARLAALPGVAAASPQLHLATLIDAACCSVSDMFMIAFDPETDFTVQPWLKQKLGEGLRKGEVIGGDYIFATEGGQNIRLYNYLVTLKTNIEPTGTGLDQTVFLTLETAYDIANKSYLQALSPLVIPENSISTVLLKVKPGSDPHEVAIQIRQKIPGVTPIESSHLFQSYRRQMAGLLKSILVVLSLTWGLSVVLIGLVFSMATNARRRELGVLRALGATRRFVFRSLLTEASLLAFLGGATGTVVCGLAIFLFRKLIMVSLDIPFLLPSPVLLAVQLGLGLFLAMLSVNLSALLPAYRSSRQDPSIAMRE